MTYFDKNKSYKICRNNSTKQEVISQTGEFFHNNNYTSFDEYLSAPVNYGNTRHQFKEGYSYILYEIKDDQEIQKAILTATKSNQLKIDGQQGMNGVENIKAISEITEQNYKSQLADKLVIIQEQREEIAELKDSLKELREKAYTMQATVSGLGGLKNEVAYLKDENERLQDASSGYEDAIRQAQDEAQHRINRAVEEAEERYENDRAVIQQDDRLLQKKAKKYKKAFNKANREYQTKLATKDSEYQTKLAEKVAEINNLKFKMENTEQNQKNKDEFKIQNDKLEKKLQEQKREIEGKPSGLSGMIDSPVVAEAVKGIMSFFLDKKATAPQEQIVTQPQPTQQPAPQPTQQQPLDDTNSGTGAEIVQLLQNMDIDENSIPEILRQLNIDNSDNTRLGFSIIATAFKQDINTIISNINLIRQFQGEENEENPTNETENTPNAEQQQLEYNENKGI